MFRIAMVGLIALFVILSVAPSFASDCDRAFDIARGAEGHIKTMPYLAEEKLRMARRLCEESPALRYDLAMILYSMGRHEEAITELDNAVTLNQNYARAFNALAFIHLSYEGGDPARAQEYAQNAVDLDPNIPEYADTLSMAEAAIQADDVDKPMPQTLKRPESVALVIGNATYRDTNTPAPANAIRDAFVFRNYLMRTMGIPESGIIYLDNARGDEIRHALGDEKGEAGELYHRAARGAEVFIFYSGLGALDKEHRPYLLPSDGLTTNLRSTAIPVSNLIESILRIAIERKPKSITLVLETCWPTSEAQTPPALDMSQLDRDRIAVFVASQHGEQCFGYPEKRHGIFSYYFLRGIKYTLMAKKSLTVAEVEKVIMANNAVTGTAMKIYNRKQTPFVLGDRTITLVQGEDVRQK